MKLESNYIGKEPCPECGSRDNLARYSDQHAYCFGCGYYEKGIDVNDKPNLDITSVHSNGTSSSGYNRPSLLGEVKSLTSRNIKEETCQHWQYRVGDYAGRPAQFAAYLDPSTRKPVAIKVRFSDKTFSWIGDPKQTGLYGEWLWKDGGKMVVITEGEIDALSVSQVQDNKWPVVSVQNGAQGAAASLKRSLEWLDKFETIVLMFDMDEPGRTAAKKCAELFAPGKAKIADLPLKDANECLKDGRAKDIISAIWNAKTFRPDGIIDGSTLWDTIIKVDQAKSIPYPWESMNEKTHGMRQGELITIAAGSGIGKSAVVREIASHLIQSGETVGMIMLEESVSRTAIGLLGLELNKPLHLSREGVTDDELKIAFDKTFGSGKVYLYDHFGSTEVDNLLSRIRYLARSLDCRWIILDHLSIVVSGLDEGGDERKLIDRAMTMLRTLVEETGIGLILVSHLKRPEGRGHEEGAQTSLTQLRGSHAIAQLSDMVIGLERDQQGENPNKTIVRVLKNRFSGETGECAELFFNRDTGRLTEVPQVASNNEEF